jgi:ubiquinone/menaquinone biosynthesis C-methylase UbiE
MESRLQRRVQRYGWDLAANEYEPLWQTRLADVQAKLLASVALEPGERVLDVACGTGLVTLSAAREVGERGRVLGVDLSGHMVDTASQRARAQHLHNVSFARMDAEALNLPDASFDVALCALGLMYLPQPEQAVREMRRVLRPGGRLGLAVWGERSRCGWSALFQIVDAEVASEVCPLFFRLGQPQALADLCLDAKFELAQHHRIAATLSYTDADEACNAAFVGGPVALAWARFDTDARARVRARYLQAIEAWRHDQGYQVPGEFVIVSAVTLGGGISSRWQGG